MKRMQGTDDEDVKTVNVHLQRVESGDLIVFPETAGGICGQGESSSQPDLDATTSCY